MRNFRCLLVLLTMAAGALGIQEAAAARPPGANPHLPQSRTGYLPGEVLAIVGADSPIAPDAKGVLRVADGRVAQVFAHHGLASIEGLGPRRASPETRILRLRSARNDFDPLQAAAELRATGRFRAVCPNYRLQLFPTLPNDFYLGDQWYVDSPDATDIALPEAWDLEHGSSSTVIAIMDTGVDTGHPDLASQIWINPGEVPGNLVDDDGNGYVDDVKGWDFGVGDSNPDPQYIEDPESGIDVGFHGTFCAGIASAATNNGQGIAGAGWNCRIMPLKISDPSGDLTASAAAEAFGYAADQGASVLSMSFGTPLRPGVPEFFQALVDMATAAGVACIAAAGNSDVDSLTYPAACNEVLAVGATDETGARAWFSNWGSWVDVGAPGDMMWSTICRNYDLTELDQVMYMYFFYWDGENPYMFGSGTSFACPLTAGVCGLLRSREPSLTPQQALQRLIASGDVVAFDKPIGRKVNAYMALNPGALVVTPDTAAPLRLESASPNPFSGTTTLFFTQPQPGPVKLSLYDCAGRKVRGLLDAPQPAGRNSATWDGTGDDGGAMGSGVYFAELTSGESRARLKLVLLER